MTLHPRFESPDDETGIDIVDPVETRHFLLLTDESVDPTPADTDAFTFPVDTACRISAGRLRLPYMVPADVRTPDGDPLLSVDSPTTRELSDDDYLVELHSPIKVYLRVSGRVRIDVTPERVTFEFEEETTVEVGARSYHSAPAATITVPDDPEATMDAVSAFSSALKTTSPERAWPTLRGHPPRVERGDELSIPSGLEAPETGVQITVPSEYWAVYTVAPLAYYLGATVVPGDRAAVTATGGVTHHLGEEPAAVADATAALLKRVFFLDCVTRTEGLYPDDLHEREVLEAHVELDFADLYEASPAERLRAYLSVPDDAIEAIASPWHRVTHVQPDAEAVEFLPYLVNDLSLVRPKTERDVSSNQREVPDQLDGALDSFLRRPSGRERTATGDDSLQSADPPHLLRNDGAEDGTDATRGVPTLDEYVTLPEVDALEQAWVGDGTPVRGTKLVREAFDHETPEPSDGTVDVAVVCNDDQMREELDSVDEIYGSRDDVPVSVTSESGVSTAELRDLLAEDHDVFHFVGHIDGRGFQCSDGVLDAATLDETNATVALLNGCRSHDQGVELVKAGANAAVVSLSDLYNSGAVEVGETLARLLHHGFNASSAMKIIRKYTSIGSRYVVVGDSSVVIAPCKGGIPTLFHISRKYKCDSEMSVTVRAYPTHGYGIGTNLKPTFFDDQPYHIALGEYGNGTATLGALQEWIENDQEPLIVDGELIWSDNWF
ncbi:hypothetical protein [Halorussus sp. MSC15.2]|uniref:hypothetical protein n=1 Tax=Halorussus sp. MSC15.2 TaxID=2283638 RepID=UPI0013D5C047|nr:hypothetical protein [Halorussus sp. MSC15.2]NEU56122.1 hypothetical protein [Halorussus sp. MSC15.2]